MKYDDNNDYNGDYTENKQQKLAKAERRNKANFDRNKGEVVELSDSKSKVSRALTLIEEGLDSNCLEECLRFV